MRANRSIPSMSACAVPSAWARARSRAPVGRSDVLAAWSAESGSAWALAIRAQTPPPPLPPDVWDALPIEARALIEVMRLQVEAMQRQIDALRHEVRSLKGQPRPNSRNSSRPPSSDPLHIKRRPPRPPSGRKRGGQPGHKRSTRPLVPPEQLAGVVTCKPDACSGCGAGLDGDDPRPIRHQVAEVPTARPEVIEYQVHRPTCPGCGKANRGPLAEGVAAGSFGPRLRAMLSLLAAEFRLAKRPIRRLVRSFLGLDISLGMVAKLERQTALVLGPVDEQLAEAVRSAPASHIDETPWRQANAKAWLRVGTGEGVTHFRIAPSRKAEVARLILGDDPAKVAICDRFGAYNWVERRSWCWPHLRRDFQAMIDRGDEGGGDGSVAAEAVRRPVPGLAPGGRG